MSSNDEKSTNKESNGLSDVASASMNFCISDCDRSWAASPRKKSLTSGCDNIRKGTKESTEC